MNDRVPICPTHHVFFECPECTNLRIAELEHDIDQYREIDKDHLKRIEVLEELVEMSYLHSDIRLHTEWFKRYKAFKGEAK